MKRARYDIPKNSMQSYIRLQAYPKAIPPKYVTQENYKTLDTESAQFPASS